MKLYLSSYKLGDKAAQFKEMMCHNKKIGYIPNALDRKDIDQEWLLQHINSDMKGLRELDLDVELLDLKNYFGASDKLSAKVDSLGGVYVSGGNVFILRQAMKLSGLDDILISLQANSDFVNSGYSAAGCVLSPSLKGYEVVDDSSDLPYSQITEAVWDGLGIVDFAFLPHYKSHHNESTEIDKEVSYFIKNNLPYKTLHDGNVMILDLN